MAIEEYQKKMNVFCEKSGIFGHPSFSYLAGTPDALVSKHGIVEVKCPFNAINADTKTFYFDFLT